MWKIHVLTVPNGNQFHWLNPVRSDPMIFGGNRCYRRQCRHEARPRCGGTDVVLVRVFFLVLQGPQSKTGVLGGSPTKDTHMRHSIYVLLALAVPLLDLVEVDIDHLARVLEEQNVPHAMPLGHLCCLFCPIGRCCSHWVCAKIILFASKGYTPKTQPQSDPPTRRSRRSLPLVPLACLRALARQKRIWRAGEWCRLTWSQDLLMFLGCRFGGLLLLPQSWTLALASMIVGKGASLSKS